MTQLHTTISEPPEQGTFVMLALLDIAEHYAPLVEVVVRQAMHCHEVSYSGNRMQFFGRMRFESPDDPDLELFLLGQAIWDVLDQHYCETILVVNPRESGERSYALESDSYEAYLKDTMTERLIDRRKELRQIKKDERV